MVAISYRDGKEISRDTLETAGAPSGVRLVPERSGALADGHDLIYVAIEIVDRDGRLVPDAQVSLKAKLDGVCALAGFRAGRFFSKTAAREYRRARSQFNGGQEDEKGNRRYPERKGAGRFSRTVVARTDGPAC